MKKAPLPGRLVLIKPIGSHMEPYTTADTVAQYAQVRHKTVNELIRKHEADLKEFGLLVFEMEAVERARGVKYAKVYHLNEQQATLLITYLRNTEPVRRFKNALVRGFFEARQELARREVERAIKAPVHRTLTDAIRDSEENERMHGQAFPTYINLIYKAVMGRTAAQMRKDAGLPKGADVVPLLTADELARVTKREAQVTTLLDCGMTYDAIQAVLLGGLSHVHTA
ncbi:Rha family transcriptional regulator [uncultured Subdoligranulum sp.]|uniref:Rha family transcriptional regulator n=1 Tax=uncultured Subdoligranulum sp. TaxID=512298 RepID=UPI0026307A94|nr:Rha family transcriptional regulator [uncultured Subdoligranulum sp.]